MSDMSYLDAIRSDDLNEPPMFPVEAPDGKRHLAELDRVATFRNLMRSLAPGVMVFANANAGRRSPTQARKEGIRGGVFDYTVAWPGGIAWPEFKGYSSAGRAGELSRAQIVWGNEMHRLGHNVASFFDPVSAIDWLRGVGCPIRNARG